MSKACECDRCGILYKDDIKFHGNDSLFIGRRPYNSDFLDLCPQCQKDLERWFTYPTRIKKEKPSARRFEIGFMSDMSKKS